MAIKINLLPSEKRVGRELQGILRITRMLGVIALGAFIVFGLGIAAFFVFTSIQLNGLNSTNSTLESQITGLETSETQIVLLKDRIGKIKTVQRVPSAIASLNNIIPVITPLSVEASVNELDVSPTKISASVNFRSNSDLSNFLKGLSTSTSFKTITLSSFAFNPASGYLVGVDIVDK